jgi:polysaccharide export outer membrane protein
MRMPSLFSVFPVLVAALFLQAFPALAQIQAGRAIQISISGVPADEKARFDPIYPVSESGMINMPFIGQVRAVGLRSEQLASILQQRYQSEGIYTNPTFQVIDSSDKTVDERVVYVGGQVKRSGPVPIRGNLTLYQAIQAAGGPTEFGSMKRVRLLRGGAQKEYDVSVSQFMRIPLVPNDTIEVPQKNMFGN